MGVRRERLCGTARVAAPVRDPERAQMGSAGSGGGCLAGARAEIFGTWDVQTGFKTVGPGPEQKGGLGK